MSDANAQDSIAMAVEEPTTASDTLASFRIPADAIEAFGPDLAERVASYAAALDAHRFSIGEPRPVEHPLVEAILAAGGMDAIEIIPTPAPPEAEPAPVVETLPTQPAPPSGDITKLRLVEFLGAAGKLREAHALLKLDAPIADLTDAELLLRERWLAAQRLDLLSPEVAPLLQAIGIEPASLIA
jgi:hypothetical protein